MGVFLPHMGALMAVLLLGCAVCRAQHGHGGGLTNHNNKNNNPSVAVEGDKKRGFFDDDDEWFWESDDEDEEDGDTAVEWMWCGMRSSHIVVSSLRSLSH